MGLFSFAKNVGKSLFGGNSDDKDKEAQIQKEIKDLGLDADGVKIKVDGDKVTIDGDAVDQETKEKIILAAGNVEGIGEVEDNAKAKDGAGDRRSKKKPSKGGGSRDGGRGNKGRLSDGRPGGGGKRRDGQAQGRQRVHSAGPTKSRGVDPDSPFAALQALKANLGTGKDDQKS